MSHVDGLTAYFARRFATKASRFNVAVSTGFVVAFVGVASIGFDRNGSAEGLFDLFGSGFSGVTQQAEVQGKAYYDEERGRRHHGRHHHGDVADDGDRPRRHHRTKVAQDGDDGAIVKVGGVGARSMCVRLCDGFAFPIGDYHGEGDRTTHEAVCQSQCPGAATALYVMPGGSDSIGDAVRVGTGKNYSQLPDAFHYTTVLDSACSCHPASGGSVKSILKDFTLRRGDAVMTQTGFKVFHGGGQFPFKRKDFLTLAQSRDVTPQARATFKTIEKASMMSSTTVAQRLAPKPATASIVNPGTKRFEHQASR